MRTPFAVCLQCDWVRVFNAQRGDAGWRDLVPARCPGCGGDVETGAAAPDELGYLAQRVARSVRDVQPLATRSLE